MAVEAAVEMILIYRGKNLLRIILHAFSGPLRFDPDLGKTAVKSLTNDYDYLYL